MDYPIYVDTAATTRVDPRVAALITELFLEEYGNAGSRTHAYGAEANRAVQQARASIAEVVAATPDEVTFTSGATESNNLAILGLAGHGKATGRRHLVTTAIEHKAVLEPMARLADEGFEVTIVAPGRDGRVDAAAVLAAVRPDTLLVSVMHANNETGAIQPIGQIAEGLEADGPYFHIDAAQTFGKLLDEPRSPRIDLISASGHKVYGPKGVGTLIARRRKGRRLPLTPLMVGGGQERGLRPGTLPVPLIAGFGLASQLALSERKNRAARCAEIRSGALAAIGQIGALVHGGDIGLDHILSFAVPGVDSEAAIVALKPYVAISNGSACTSASYEPSHVLTAMKLDGDEIAGTVRMSWSHDTPDLPWVDVIAALKELKR
ncbi:aminotransferase class V-fold PLP-dependent enzyme [Caulobacter sp. CCNWLY153]|uniref:aminotransferase class V-fold PLP-dependent enzyme n=1 Tax=unclassified Caulobacter TaxID=2648921 RepID=UPI002FF2A1F4